MGLKDILPANVRRVLFVVWGFASLIASTIQVAVLATPGGEQPNWLTVSIAVLLFLGTSLGFTAAANVPTTQPTLFVNATATKADLTPKEMENLRRGLDPQNPYGR